MTSPELRFAAAQFDILYNAPAANIARAEALLPSPGQADLVALPEMFTTGFHPHEAIAAEPPHGPTEQWMLATARRLGAVVTGSIAVRDGAQLRNRLLWATPGGQALHYDKRHLFSYAGEDQTFAAGSRRVVFEHLGWRVLPQVCYDLRFPVFARNRGDYDLALYVASWPESRARVWEHLLVARAMENQAYVAGVNRVGADARGTLYGGHTLLAGPEGNIEAHAGDNAPRLVTATLSRQRLDDFRASFPALADADAFRLDIEP